MKNFTFIFVFFVRSKAPSPPTFLPSSPGYDLLKKKSDALTVRLRSLLKEIKEVRPGVPARVRIV